MNNSETIFDQSIDIKDIKLMDIHINKPRKTEDSLFGKAVYGEMNSLNVFITNAQVIKHKRVRHLEHYYSILLLKVPKDVCKTFIDFDAYCVEHVKTNMNGWFTKSLDENIIEEFYTPSVSYSKTDGFLLKLKIQNAEDILDCSVKYDMILNFRGLRFYKQRFIPEWGIENVKSIDIDFLNSYNSDEENDWEQNSDVIETTDIQPSLDDIKNIQSEMIHKIQNRKQDINNQLSPLLHQLETLDKLLIELDQTDISVQLLDKISEQIEIDNLL